MLKNSNQFSVKTNNTKTKVFLDINRIKEKIHMVASLYSGEKTDKYNLYPLKIVIRVRWDCVLKNVWQIERFSIM